MKVFKFGGASVKNAQSVRNVAEILGHYSGEKLIVVISAMGKTTNALENIYDHILQQNQLGFNEKVAQLKAFHLTILEEIIFNDKHPIFYQMNGFFNDFSSVFNEKEQKKDFLYAKVVSFGEFLSTKIVHAYLKENNFKALWESSGDYIKTKADKFIEADIDWKQSEQLFQDIFKPKFEDNDIVVTQGFIGQNSNGETTTLGREGSDFSAGIIAYCCSAESVTIWKDVPGMLNADPKWFDNTIKLDNISFREAIELSYYGASVIHPKTIKPLQNKGIPLYVKSFLAPKEKGTKIHTCTDYDHLVPSFIFKKNQILFSITPKDFSFIEEKNLSHIFQLISSMGLRINVMQNSALSFSVLLDENKVSIDLFLKILSKEYDVKYNSGLELITIRHYDEKTIQRLTQNKEILLQQLTRETARLIVK